jgi:hypothetical protein
MLRLTIKRIERISFIIEYGLIFIHIEGEGIIQQTDQLMEQEHCSNINYLK